MGPSCLLYLRIPELELERERRGDAGEARQGSKSRQQIAVTATHLIHSHSPSLRDPLLPWLPLFPSLSPSPQPISRRRRE